jgi:hypothetical protein
VRISRLWTTFESPFADGFEGDPAIGWIYRRRFALAFADETVLLIFRATRVFKAFRRRRAVFGALLIFLEIVPKAEPMVRATRTSVSFSELPLCP